MTPRKLKNLQKNIHAAAFLVACPCPLGVNRDAWAEATNALYKANEQIDRIVKEMEKGEKP